MRGRALLYGYVSDATTAAVGGSRAAALQPIKKDPSGTACGECGKKVIAVLCVPLMPQIAEFRTCDQVYDADRVKAMGTVFHRAWCDASLS